MQPYGRLLPYRYGDGIYTLPRSVTGGELPLPRELSLILNTDRDVRDYVWNLYTMQWGQIIAHDMSHTSGVGVTDICCSQSQLLQNETSNPKCATLVVPSNDPYHVPEGTQCLIFQRTVSSRDIGCTASNAPSQPLSDVTSFMDMSIVYGSNKTEAEPLRSGVGGKLRTVVRNGQHWPPQIPNVTANCNAQSSTEPCYLAGDGRVNQNPELALLQIVLLREHNRIAETLASRHTDWDDETIFQESRRVNIAVYQHINYYEYFPILLGNDNMVKNKLIYPDAESYINDYNPEIDPAVLAEHGSAAYRHFHTLIRGYLDLFATDQTFVSKIRLSDWFNKPSVLEWDNNFNDLARGMAKENQYYSDQYMDSEITQYLFRNNDTFGNDLAATDIQRGRDMGLAGYVATRQFCGLSTPETFDDMSDYISLENIEKLKSLYASPWDIDLMVGGRLEELVPGTLVGNTFLCILTEQFYRTRASDRYFYENGADAETAFTLDQLTSIRNGSSMARLICDNVDDMKFMQRWAFELVGLTNPIVPCEELPSVDLSLW